MQTARTLQEQGIATLQEWGSAVTGLPPWESHPFTWESHHARQSKQDGAPPIPWYSVRICSAHITVLQFCWHCHRTEALDHMGFSSVIFFLSPINWSCLSRSGRAFFAYAWDPTCTDKEQARKSCAFFSVYVWGRPVISSEFLQNYMSIKLTQLSYVKMINFLFFIYEKNQSWLQWKLWNIKTSTASSYSMGG